MQDIAGARGSTPPVLLVSSSLQTLLEVSLGMLLEVLLRVVLEALCWR
jgi:hypothetical protein